MTPSFWQYLITHGDDSEIRFVAENEPEAADEELEGTPGLLSYRAKPQIYAPVSCRPDERRLQQLGRAQLQRMEAKHMHDSVVTISHTNWPAHRKKNRILVDPNDRSPKPRLIFRPDKLRDLGIPAALIDAAAKSNPQGLILFEDLSDQAPSAKGTMDQTTTESAT
jgi:hypothetical protein